MPKPGHLTYHPPAITSKCPPDLWGERNACSHKRRTTVGLTGPWGASRICSSQPGNKCTSFPMTRDFTSSATYPQQTHLIRKNSSERSLSPYFIASSSPSPDISPARCCVDTSWKTSRQKVKRQVRLDHVSFPNFLRSSLRRLMGRTQSCCMGSNTEIYSNWENTPVANPTHPVYPGLVSS